MQQKVLIVLGMHRSGTSLAARLVNLLGIDLGNRLIPPAENNNPKGFWEHDDVWRIHDRLLQTLGGREWHTVLPLPHEWWLDEKVKSFKHELLAVLRRDFSGYPFWGIKDPRMSRLLPLWKLILSDMNCKPYFLHVIRNPIEVAASLERRDGLNIYKSILMWFQHVSESETETRGHPRSFVTFSQLLTDWQSAVNRIARELKIEWPTDPDRVRQEIDEYIDGTLKHHSESDEVLLGRHEIPYYITDAYLEVVKAAHGPDHDVPGVLSRGRQASEKDIQTYFPILGMLSDLNSGEFSLFKQQIMQRAAALEGLQGQLAQKDAALEELQGQLAQRDASLEELQVQLTSTLSSRSWRLTAPLRMAAKRLRRFQTRPSQEGREPIATRTVASGNDPGHKTVVADRVVKPIAHGGRSAASKDAVIITGMHRSGTSCLAGTLQRNGMLLGKVFEWNPHNKKGNRENENIMLLNESILTASSGSWDSPPAELTWTEEHETRRDDIIREMMGLSGNHIWGFKDPRVVLTLPFWKDGLDSIRLVGTFRHPLSVAYSLWSRNKINTRSLWILLWVYPMENYKVQGCKSYIKRGIRRN